MRQHHRQLFVTSLLVGQTVQSLGASAAPAMQQAVGSTEQAIPVGEPIVVSGKRRGEAQVAAETEISQDEIADYDVQNVRELLDEIAARIGDADGSPALIVNGRRVTDPREIARFPPEALQRLEVLPREAAGIYGFSPQRRVVNLVLKNQFENRNAQASLSAPTAGGRLASDLGLQQVLVNGDARWSADVALQQESALAEVARNRPALVGTTDGAAGTGGASVAAGLLAQGPAMAASSHTEVDASDAFYRDILGSSRAFRFNAGTTQPLGEMSATLGLRASLTQNNQRIGLATASIVAQSPGAWDRLPEDFRMERMLASGRALHATSSGRSLGLSAGLAGKIFGGDADIALSIDHATSSASTDRNGASGIHEGTTASSRRAEREQRLSVSDNAAASLAFSRKVVNLAAGPARIQLGANVAISRSRAKTGPVGNLRANNDRNIARSAQASLVVPLVRKGVGALGGIGDVSTSLRLGAAAATATPVRLRRDLSLSWSPGRRAGLTVRLGQEDNSPSADQRTSPRVETYDVRLYDYRTGTLALVTQVSGGNPDLVAGKRTSFAVGANLAFGTLPQISLRTDFQAETVTGGVAALPELTGAVEGAFPERVGRNEKGELVLFDIRPINISSEHRSTLRSALNLSFPLSKVNGAARSTDKGAAGTQRRQSAADQSAPVRPVARRDTARLQLSASHDWLVSNQVETRLGLPVLDRLAGDGGGQSRHRLSLQGLFARRGTITQVSVSWQSRYRTRMMQGLDGPGDLVFASKATVSVRLGFALDRLLGAASAPRWTQGLRVGLDITNLLDGRQSVRRGDGSVPPGFSRDEIDPLGRLVQLSLRRRL